MQARGLLMMEHRLIERMFAVVKNVLADISTKQKVDPVFIDVAVDFIRVYADRTHHGKEEEILFRKLNNKSLSAEDRRIMKELMEQHDFGRQTTKTLVEANARYRAGDQGALADISDSLRFFVEFYLKHIEKEDKTFFPASRTYISDEEDHAMVAEFEEFDRKIIHEKYEALVQGLEAGH